MSGSTTVRDLTAARQRLRATKGLAKKGVLIDLTGGDATIEIWAASPTPCLLVRRQVSLEITTNNHAFYEHAVRDLTLADLQHPGWLEQTADLLNKSVPGPGAVEREPKDLIGPDGHLIAPSRHGLGV